ncbi:unnamed protein product [Lampetra planeri]
MQLAIQAPWPPEVFCSASLNRRVLPLRCGGGPEWRGELALQQARGPGRCAGVRGEPALKHGAPGAVPECGASPHSSTGPRALCRSAGRACTRARRPGRCAGTCWHGKTYAWRQLPVPGPQSAASVRAPHLGSMAPHGKERAIFSPCAALTSLPLPRLANARGLLNVQSLGGVPGVGVAVAVAV